MSLILLVVVLFVAERGGKENLEHVTDTCQDDGEERNKEKDNGAVRS